MHLHVYHYCEAKFIITCCHLLRNVLRTEVVWSKQGMFVFMYVILFKFNATCIGSFMFLKETAYGSHDRRKYVSYAL